ncbi:hypothetical protein EDD16DRAFT_1691796 [Pisolithus croceorrhizus]|nr:hypothetical protein EDD16DRAFT_1691796 [Pisolithus croceorrhizus]
MSVWRLMKWMLTGSKQKSEVEVTNLVSTVITAEDFRPKDPQGFSAHMEMKWFDMSEKSLHTDHMFRKDGWMEASISIEIPTHDHNPSGNGQTFTIPLFFYHKLTTVIEAAFLSHSFKYFHLAPFWHIWQSPATGKEQWLFDELYTSDAWIRAHDEVQKQRCDDRCTLEWVITGLMLWSDATHLTQFGHASAWPVYLFFGNQSNSGACHLVAFFPKKKNQSDIFTHCNILLDKDFVNAHKNGIIVKCYDGVCHRVFPRIFTYSANYPEKVLLATIRDKGECPCPCCIIPKANFYKLGLLSDLMARATKIRQYFCNRITAAHTAIYKLGAPIKGAAPEQHLKSLSLVPTLNSFAEMLGPLGWDIFTMFTVDLLHKFELGVFKSVFRHLLRLLHAINLDAINILNAHFHEICSFGKGSIWQFSPDVSDIHHCIAWHFQNVLQCAIPAFEGLLPHEHDSIFTCASFQTTELPSETTARQRREAKFESQKGESMSTSHSGMCKLKTFNLSTYKIHALGNYVDTIHMFGTTDSYLTQIGELAHQQLKKFYQSTNKHDPMSQLAKQERQFTHAHQELDAQMTVTEPEEREESVPLTNHYHLSYSSHNIVSLPAFLNDHSGDPAIKDQDTLCSGQGDTIMMHSCEQGTDAHPFWYAQLIRAWVFHVYYKGVEHDMDMVWVHWLGVKPGYEWGINKAQLPKVGFMSDSKSGGAFGFVDLALVDDWASYHVNIFADRDMFARFSHVGVGHKAQYAVPARMSKEDISAELEEEGSSQVPDNKGPPYDHKVSMMDEVDSLNDCDNEDDDGSGDCTDSESSLDEDRSDRDSNSEGDINSNIDDLIF